VRRVDGRISVRVGGCGRAGRKFMGGRTRRDERTGTVAGVNWTGASTTARFVGGRVLNATGRRSGRGLTTRRREGRWLRALVAWCEWQGLVA